MVGKSRVWLSIVSLSILLVSLLTAAGATMPSAALASGSFYADDGTLYDYGFYGVDGAAIRGKAAYGFAADVSCAGGVNIPGGGLIVATGADRELRAFRYWLYPPGTDSVIIAMVANARIENAPPDGWGDGGVRPVEACSLFHRNNDGTYRLKTMFTSLHGRDGQGRNLYDLALLDTGIELRLSPR